MKSIGDAGEDRAVEYLQQHKLKIVERNWSGDGGEIDIIARYKKQIHFVEVKVRKNSMNEAWLAVSPTKQRRLQRTAQQWIQQHGQDKWSYQFDVIAISGQTLEHRQNVVEAST